MKAISVIILLACFPIDVSSTPQESPLQIIISRPPSAAAAESGVVIFTMKNQGADPVYVLKPLTPFSTTGERLTNNVFEVLDARGINARYTSIYNSGVAYVSDGIDGRAFFRMSPGDSLSREIDLSKSYDLSTGGIYTLRFNRPVIGEPAQDERGVSRFLQIDSARQPISNTLDISVKAVLEMQDKTLGLYDTPQATVCEASKQDVIDAAMSRAMALSTSATQHNASLWYYEGEGNTFTAKLKNDFRRNNWLGSYDPNWLAAIDPHWFDTENFYPIKVTSAIALRLGGIPYTRPISFDCACPPEWGATDLTAAVALSNQKIGICPRFFELSDGGFDTKAGALIHEAAHFSDDLAQGAVDIRYGTGPSAQLAKDNKSAAIRNADNYKFFVESGGL